MNDIRTDFHNIQTAHEVGRVNKVMKLHVAQSRWILERLVGTCGEGVEEEKDEK